MSSNTIFFKNSHVLARAVRYAIAMTLLKEPVCLMPGMWYLPGFAQSREIWPAIRQVIAAAPLRHMQTQRGFKMSVAMTNCGDVGWTSDRRGYRYSAVDPETDQPWPELPAALRSLANSAAAAAGFDDYEPDACLINQYKPGAQMGAHQDRNERSFDYPIVSASLGIPARFFIQGEQKGGKSQSIDLHDGDVLVFGGEARCHFHGVRKLKQATHPQFGSVRWNLTFRVAQ